MTTTGSKNFISIKLVIYCVGLFLMFVVIGEVIARSLALDHNPLQRSNYYPAIDHLTRIARYVEQYGAPDCLFFGSSLVQRGINPALFESAFQMTSGQPIRCYNAGMDGSSLSSTLPMVRLFTQEYHPKYVIVGIQRNSFALRENAPTEDRLPENSWLRYQIGYLNIEGAATEYFTSYRALTDLMLRWFPNERPVPVASESVTSSRIRPEVPRIINMQGYGPMVGYADTSPLFQPNFRLSEDTTLVIDPKDVAAFDELISLSNRGAFQLIFVEMPVFSTTDVFEKFLRQLEETARQNRIPFLSTNKLSSMPVTAYTDQIHLYAIGSFMFSDWLGEQLGTAVSQGVLSDMSSPLWQPTQHVWDDTSYAPTLGLSAESFQRYQEVIEGFQLVPIKSIIFNPATMSLDRVYTQSLLGFAYDWEGERSDEYRLAYLQLMVVLEKMRFRSELTLSKSQQSVLQTWYTTPNASLLQDLGIQYVVCRRELATEQIHCPDIRNDPAYTQVAQWNFDPLYEQYTLYQVMDVR